jgi:hypothetical protein
MMRALVFLLLFVLSATHVAAESKVPADVPKIDGSVRSALYAYDKHLVAKDRREMAEWINAMQIGMMWANVMLKDRGQPMLYCQPEIAITNDQMLDMLRRAVKDNPKWGDFPVALAVLVTLQWAFPCDKQDAR